MKFRKSALAAALATTLAMGVAETASATEYGRSQLFIDNLTVLVSPGAGSSISNFNFSSTNTAFVNNVGGASTANCGGQPSPGANNCGAGPVLDAAVVNAGSGTQGPNTFTINGPGAGGSYANGDSVILTAELVTGTPSSTRQQAEAEINPGATSASASTEIASTTGFTFTFDITDDASLALQFDALLNILADINDPTALAASAQANTEFEMKLQNNADSTLFAVFAPNGTLPGGCAATGALACVGVIEEFDLNTDVGVTGLPASSLGRSNTAANDHFAATITGLTAGQWTFTLTAKTSTSLSRTAVPEPTALALMGIGLAGLGVTRRKKLV